MLDDIRTFNQDDRVRHNRMGAGRVILDQGTTSIVQFEHGIESVLNCDLQKGRSLLDAAASEIWDLPLKVITRVQAEAIQSINDLWGVFSQSRIALLPHQLWVCRKVNESWPTHWLVADDVGLGKTIEAGLILWPLISRGTVKRLLIVCPSSLVNQWQERMREMFDIRLSKYLPELDTPRSDYWNTHNQVVASLQTLRIDHGKRHERLMASDQWDMLMVDEAHHLNADEKTGPTLGYRLVEKLVEANRVQSTIFFTGTPHRGKNFGFWSLMKLLRPEIFGPDKPSQEQLGQLRHTVIRNNKQNVTDIKGNRLFKKPAVFSGTYTYSPEEEYFYQLLTDFISTGKAYASSLGAADQRLAMLVLITMQKLASSSVSAIKRALRNRLKRTGAARQEKELLERQKQLLEERFSEYGEAEESFDLDRINELEDRIGDISYNLTLMEGEEPRIRELLDAADKITDETKINEIINNIKDRFVGRSVLMFTEYKATQSLMMSKLMQLFGDDSVTFINGDERAEEVVDSSGQARTISVDRRTAASKFNSGEVRFLISTEAGGEGIDLQEHCHTLFHIDLPWNPMRLHQRVGRLNRYGQKEQVTVVQLHNPDTVESRIWKLLDEKIGRIMETFDQVMDEPEDLMELVLGMTSPSMLREVFAEAGSVSPTGLNQWFDQKTATFGGKDVVDAVKDIVGNVSQFDYQQISAQIPQVDLPDLEEFIRSMLVLNRRRVQRDDDGISFNTPDAWTNSVGVQRSYQGLIFDRSNRSHNAVQRVLGVGHKVMDVAMAQAKEYDETVTSIRSSFLEHVIVVFKITDRVSTESGVVRFATAGVQVSLGKGDDMVLLRDEELLVLLNGLSRKPGIRQDKESRRPADIRLLEEVLTSSEDYLNQRIDLLNLPFVIPNVFPSAVLWPSQDSVDHDAEEISCPGPN